MHRRQLITGVPAIWIAAQAIPANAKDVHSIDDMVEALKSKLEDCHGGTWVCKRDSGLLMVQKI